MAHDPGALHADRDEPRVLLVEAGAAGPDRFLAPEGTATRSLRPATRGVPVWLVVDVGRRLPSHLFDVVVGPLRPARGVDPVEVVPIAEAERVVEPRRIDCPVPPELLRAPSGW